MINLTFVSVYKCCDSSNATDARNDICPDFDNRNDFVKSLDGIRVKDSSEANISWTYMNNDCEKFFVEEPWYLLSDGSLHADYTYGPSDFCLELTDSGLSALACFDDLPEDSVVVNSELQNKVYPAGMLISLPFFAVNLLVYTLLHELRRSVHGKAFIFHQLSMFVGYSILASLYFYRRIELTECIVSGKFIIRLD